MGQAQAKYIYNGLIGLPEIAKAHGVSVGHLAKRMQLGMTLEEAIETPTQKQQTYTYKGKKGLANIAEANGVKVCNLKYRINKLGMTLAQAIDDIKTNGLNRPPKEEEPTIIISSGAKRSCPFPSCAKKPAYMLAFGLITRGQYDEIINS